MKKYPLVILGAVILASSWASAVLTAPRKAPAKPRAKQAQSAAGYRAQGFAPGFDDMMTMLVQPRHIKLYYAGAAKNWELAAAESRNLRQSFDNIAQGIPAYQGNNVAEAMGAYVNDKLSALDAAIANADSGRFAGAYKNLTAGCNDCHHYMEHPFIVIKVPSGAQDAVHPDQDFAPGH